MSKTFGPGTKQQRYVPYGRQAGACSLKVPLETHPDGQMFEGRYTVPTRLAKAAPHSNDELAFRKLRMDMFRRWTEWKAQKGWNVVPGSVQVTEPYPNPVANTQTEGDEETMTVSFFARFKRETYLYLPLDDQLELERLYAIYGVDRNPDALSFNDVSGSEDTGWVDPVKYALERKAKLGLKPEEHHITEWREAELAGEKWQPK